MSLFGTAIWKGIHKPPLGDFSEGGNCPSVYK